MLLPFFHIISYFDFILSWTFLGLTKFIEKFTNIFNTTYQNIFNDKFNETNLSYKFCYFFYKFDQILKKTFFFLRKLKWVIIWNGGSKWVYKLTNSHSSTSIELNHLKFQTSYKTGVLEQVQ